MADGLQQSSLGSHNRMPRSSIRDGPACALRDVVIGLTTLRGENAMHADVNWENPYLIRQGTWLRGSLHVHTKERSGCAASARSDMLSMYADAGYDFIAISDHMSYRKTSHRHLTVIPGVEWNSSRGEHTGVYSLNEKLIESAIAISDQQLLLHRLAGEDALVVLNHPNWQEPPHYSREQLAEKRFFSGIEIYNAVIEVLEGQALSTDKWDFLLSRGQRVAGFASDDAHHTDQTAKGWLMVRAKSRDARDIFRSLREGNFHASTGVSFSEIWRDDSVVTVASPDAEEIHATGHNGRRLARVEGGFMEFDLSRNAGEYVRFTAYGRGARMAWTQPFFPGESPSGRWRSGFVTDWKMSGLMTSPQGDIANTPFVPPGRRASWKTAPVSDSPAGFVNVHPVFEDGDGIVCFSSAFKAPRTATWRVLLGHDGGMAMFVDGKRVLAEPIRRNPAVPARSSVDIRLSAGNHDILLAFDTDHGMGWGFFFQFEVPPEQRPHFGKPAFPRILPAKTA